ncbi:transcriptional regulator, ArsR family [Halomicrobium zhouii]|uniref:Transcriptional regulator, ArsR family n=1 Tax=Halomicrobium zhouii TaxID=767519 RepID=A0A1I6M9E7_9EURY|nr:helix-turn-helix domain-containing protein [Halomicrobium zhouii]SFS12243.1 transcriptional regulator, ArsR family [Halomicrobium zhouii]
MTNDWDPETLFDVLGSEEVRRILALADAEPMSASELADRLDASQPTVYRRVNVCEKYDLLAERSRVDGDGNHYKEYETTLQRICFEVEDGGFDVSISLRHDLVDRFGDFWSDLERGGRDG